MSEAGDSPVRAVVWDVGRVLYHWELRHLFRKLIADERELDWFLAHVVTEEWHFEHDAGRDLAEMVAERSALYPGHARLIEAYATRFDESIPGPVAGTHEIAALLAERGVPQFAMTNFASLFWARFRPTAPVFDLFADIVVSGDEKLAKPDPRIFDLAAGRFGHDPREMLFIDDNRANIEAAARLGWQVHHFSEAARLAADPRMTALLTG